MPLNEIRPGAGWVKRTVAQPGCARERAFKAMRGHGKWKWYSVCIVAFPAMGKAIFFLQGSFRGSEKR